MQLDALFAEDEGEDHDRENRNIGENPAPSSTVRTSDGEQNRVEARVDSQPRTPESIATGRPGDSQHTHQGQEAQNGSNNG